MGPLGRNYPKTFDHAEKYALSDTLAASTAVQPVAPGFNWYSSFDEPQKGSDGRYVLKTKRLGYIRGGHCTCLCPPSMLEKDTLAFWRFFNQKQEGACEGFGHARRKAIMLERTFDAFHLYDDARRIENEYPQGEGTSNDATCQALKKWGLHVQYGVEAHRINSSSEPVLEHASSYRWALTVEQVWKVLGITDGGPAPLINSWGEDYPHVVYMPPETFARLLHEGGECDVITDLK
jgi:hypothetical protein